MQLLNDRHSVHTYKSSQGSTGNKLLIFLTLAKSTSS